jgi:hypothetical protein
MMRGLVFVIGGALVAIPGIAIVEPTLGRLLPGRAWVLSLVAVGAALVCVAAASWAIRGDRMSPGAKSRRLSRLFLAAAFAVQAATFIGVFRAPPGTSAGVGFLAGGILIAPLLVAALVCAVHAYFAARRPVGLAEVAAFLVAGFALMLPAVHVSRMLT